MKQAQIRLAPAGAKHAEIKARDEAERLTVSQLLARLRTTATLSNEVYWAKCELRKRGYCV